MASNEGLTQPTLPSQMVKPSSSILQNQTDSNTGNVTGLSSVVEA